MTNRRAWKTFFAAGLLLAAVGAPVFARPVPQNLANGLDKIVENRLLQNGTATAPVLKGRATGREAAAYLAAYKAEVSRQAAVYQKMAIAHPTTAGKYLVDIMPDGKIPVGTLQATLLASFPRTEVTQTDTKYAGHGVIEGYIHVDDARAISKLNGVGSVILQLRPVHSVGSVTEFGVNQHRVNRVNTSYNAASLVNYDGTGMSIGVLSDSYNSQPSMEGGTTTAQMDVLTGDLPGNAATSGNGNAVFVLEDYNPTGGATNEGRGMCQIVADMAPKAKIGFATADTGELGFANNIRGLGGINTTSHPAAASQGFKADVICDDVAYLDEPFFQDGIIAQGVIDVVNNGISYCSSAANNWGTDGYASVFRPVANGTGLIAPVGNTAGNNALTGTNIDLTGVDPALYAGGFHNFNPNGGLDVAQTFNTGSDPQAAVFQWNDPFDTSVPVPGQLVTGPLQGNSTLTAPSMDFPVTFTAGQAYLIIEMATPNVTPPTPPENFDAIVDIVDNTDPANPVTVLSQDTGTDETVYYTALKTGNYIIRVHPFATMAPVGGVGVPTMGHYVVNVYKTTVQVQSITQDFNLLFFDMTGKFISAVATNNIASNRPVELFVPTFSADGYSQVQLVISRANTTTLANAANYFKYVFFGNGLTGIGPAEYNDYLTPVTFGHSAVAGANSVAAYSCFRPNLPEDFTSPGPVTVYFNTDNSRKATPELRLKPDIAAADGSNNTFFPLGAVQDVPFDADGNYANFYGTSAASPHAAAIAALVIQAHKPAVLTPAQVKTLMQLNAFPHDLDPYASGGTATVTNGTTNIGTVTVNVVSDNDPNTGTGSNDPNSWTVSYVGAGNLKTISFNPEGTAATGGNVTGGNFNGNQTGATPADFLVSTNYKFTPGMVFKSSSFLNTGTSTGLRSADATATYTNQATAYTTLNPAPAGTTFYWTFNLAFNNNNFTTGKLFHFNVGRNQQQDAQTPQGQTTPALLYGQTAEYSADILGDGVLIPEYADNKMILPGMTFSGTVVNGATSYPFSGRIANKVGVGYSRLDGYGFVNVQAATTAALPTVGVVSRKVHGSAGTFDLPLPLTGTPAIEPRVPDAGNGFQLVYTLAETVNLPGTATVAGGTATVASTVVGPLPNQVTVNLTGVANAQRLVVTLAGVQGNSGAALASLAAPFNVLVGDVTASGRTDAGDVIQVRAQAAQPITQSNFIYDVNVSGRIDAGDVIVTRNAAATALP